MSDRSGTLHAELTNGSNGAVRAMQFSEPPPEMQISAERHRSLGPDRIGAWPGCANGVSDGEARPGSPQEDTVAGLQVTVDRACPALFDHHHATQPQAGQL